MVEGSDGPGETKSNEDASGVSSSESSNRSISILSTSAFGSTSRGGEVGKGSTNGNQNQGLDGGSHVEHASNSGGNFKNKEGNEADGNKRTSESQPSSHVAAWGNASEEEFPGHRDVLHKAFISGDFFGILRCEHSGLLELLRVGELSRLVQDSLKAGTECEYLFILFFKSDLNDGVFLEFGSGNNIVGVVRDSDSGRRVNAFELRALRLGKKDNLELAGLSLAVFIDLNVDLTLHFVRLHGEHHTHGLKVFRASG